MVVAPEAQLTAEEKVLQRKALVRLQAEKKGKTPSSLAVSCAARCGGGKTWNGGFGC